MLKVAVTLAAMLFANGAGADALDSIKAKGVMSLGYRTDAPPFSYEDELGEPAGLAVSLCREAAKSVREAIGSNTLRVSYMPVTAANRFDALISGEIDLLCGPTTATLTRRRALDFSIPYFIDGSSVVMRLGEAETLEDLVGARIGVLAGTTTERIVTGLNETRSLNADLARYDTHVDGLAALEGGEIAAYFGDQAILRYLIGQLRPKTALKFSTDQYSFEPYALAMRRGESRLRLAVDRALSRSFGTGQIYTHIEASLGEVSLSDLARSVYQIVALPE